VDCRIREFWAGVIEGRCQCLSSEVIGVSEEKLEEAGVFNGFVDIDSRLYVDPRLLRGSTAPELKESLKRFKSHFRDVFTLLRNSGVKNDAMWRQARNLLTFKEKPVMALGYAIKGTQGSAIGRGLADALTETAHQIISAGIVEPTIFELVGLLEEGIGPDRISDMSVAIIFPDLLEYSARIAKEMGLETVKRGKTKIPCDPETRKGVVMLPEDILSALPVAFDWDSRDFICVHNEQLRAKVNPIIGKTWRQASRVKKKDLRQILFKYPELIRDALDIYKSKKPGKYDFGKDPSGEFAWNALAKRYAGQYPLGLQKIKLDRPENVFVLVERICEKYKVLVEDNGLWEMFWYNGKVRHERIAQLNLFGVADAYCEANNIDITREANSGRGPVDFKFSRGYKSRVTVEVKYSTNTKLWGGWQKQLPIYNKAEKTKYSIFLIIRTSDNYKTIEKIQASAIEEGQRGRRAPKVIVIDGRPVPPASQA
jgi:hypothetical protein